MSRIRRHRGRLLLVCSIAAIAALGGAVAAAVANSPSHPANGFTIPVPQKGPPKGVPMQGYFGSASGNPNDVVSRIVVLHGPMKFLRAATDTTPPISGVQALSLAWQQLGPADYPTTATATLGTDPFTGKEAWVVTYTNVCMAFPNEVGSLNGTAPSAPSGLASDTHCMLSIELDASTGDFISAS